METSGRNSADCHPNRQAGGFSTASTQRGSLSIGSVPPRRLITTTATTMPTRNASSVTAHLRFEQPRQRRDHPAAATADPISGRLDRDRHLVSDLDSGHRHAVQPSSALVLLPSTVVIAVASSGSDVEPALIGGLLQELTGHR